MDNNIKDLLEIWEKKIDTDKLKELAKKLMNEYCIYNGQYHYRPIEIEFYIYDKDKHADEHVYYRNKKAGELFFHYSGMDICFESSSPQPNNGNKDVRFGGILIRALERIESDNQLFGGPLVCMCEIINTATEKCKVKKKPISESKNIDTFGQRVGIKAKNEKDTFYNKKYRFVRQDIVEKVQQKNKKLFSPRDSFDFNNKTCTTKPSSYKIEEYIPKK